MHQCLCHKKKIVNPMESDEVESKGNNIMSKANPVQQSDQDDSVFAEGASDNGEANAYDEAVRKGPPLDSGIRIAVGGRRLEENLEAHHGISPGLSGGDVDAAWQEAESAGDEAVGGSVTPPIKT